jgi:hypothetical protein
MMASPDPAGGEWLVEHRQTSRVLGRPDVVVLTFLRLDDDRRIVWVTDPHDATAFLTRERAAAHVRRPWRGPDATPGRTRIVRFCEAIGLARQHAAGALRG